MRFLNPKTDFAFKRIFGSEQSRDILLSFLNAIPARRHHAGGATGLGERCGKRQA